MWEQLLEKSDVLKTTGDPSPKTPQIPMSNQFPSNEDPGSKVKGKKKKVVMNKQMLTKDERKDLEEGTGPGETEDKSAGQVQYEKQAKAVVGKKQPLTTTDNNKGQEGTRPSSDMFPSNAEPVVDAEMKQREKMYRKAIVTEGAALVLKALSKTDDE